MRAIEATSRSLFAAQAAQVPTVSAVAVDEAFSVPVGYPDVAVPAVAGLVDGNRRGRKETHFVGRVRRAGQGYDLSAVETELHHLALARRYVPLVRIVGGFAHFGPGVGEPEALVAVVFDKSDPVTLL